MDIKTILNREKKKLINKAIKQGGVYENFGGAEYLNLKDKYGDSKELDLFFNWCISRDDKNLTEGLKK